MSSENPNSGIQLRPVLERDDVGTRLFGWALEEIVATVVALGIGFMFVPGGLSLKIIPAILTAVYMKQVRSHLPDNFISRAIAYYRQPNRLLRASSRDTEWKPPYRNN